jgi:serine phosphatase RsbU (regulator of sigma subunit)
MMHCARKWLLLILIVSLALVAGAQTPAPAPAKSYLRPGDSLWFETSLVSGDVLTWSLWLAASKEDAGKTMLVFRSDEQGEIWRREFGPETVDLREDVKIKSEARYRLTVFSEGRAGRPAALTAWTKLASAGRTPFPPPSVKRLAERFAPGDQFAVEFEFALPDTTRFQTLLAYELPSDIVRMWAVSPSGDSIAAVPSVRRWIGEGGTISLHERTPRGGRISLRLEVEALEAGEHTVYLAPGTKPPAWLPSVARFVVSHKHDPWRVVIVPPQNVVVESLATRSPEPPRLPFAAQQFRVSGMDSFTAAKLLPIIAERDSLMNVRRERYLARAQYDTLFLRGHRAFLPPDLHVAVLTPLTRSAASKRKAAAAVIHWFVENPRGGPLQGDVYEWRYGEARVAFPSAPSEFFWDPDALPLKPELSIRPPASPDKPQVVTLPAFTATRPPVWEHDGASYPDHSRAVWGLYLNNRSADTLYLAYHRESRSQRSLITSLSRWPKGARYTAIVLLILVACGGLAVYLLRRREAKRRHAAAELEEELEKARAAQLKLLPNAPLEIEDLHIIGLHQSMQSVGGDYYDFFALEDGSVLICVADVTGHGYKAALIMSNLQATLRAVAQPGRSVSEIASLLNLEVFKRTNPEDFVTFILGRINPDRTRVTVCNAGHNPGYIVQPSGRVLEITEGGIMLGALDMFPFGEKDYPLEPGDTLAFYTDGIPEATLNRQGEMYGYERLKLFLAEHRYSGLSDTAQKLLRQVTPTDNRPIEDDMAIVLARVER